MKIIGKSKDAYIVEITEAEIANCCGFISPYSVDWRAFIHEHLNGRRNSLEVGDEFNVKQISDWHHNLNYKKNQAIESAGFLRSLADMIENVPHAFMTAPSEDDVEKHAKEVLGDG